ncbi:dihydroorotase family protein [Sporomusa sp. KB1]|jgi:dihydropyrimidinase/allantoinase|uniref:dihydroorotase n=1 Tax=Sporomusa sp. KB1 TaxID=943346 RepID=UPI0011A0CD3C|nr:dihydroorotase family protein [Sporomusa sp. KB1]TWH47924.1 dihydropyrimidinase/allantoinase [Sporomusa sp. KB1]
MDKKMDVVLQNVQVVGVTGIAAKNVGVADGRIAVIAEPSSHLSGERLIEGKGLFLLPGLIDTHMHVRGPAFSQREDFFSGTAAAAAGGITTVLEMPVSKPPTYSVEVLQNRLACAGRQALVDFAFYGAAGKDNVQEIAALAKAGVIGFKTFTQSAPAGREQEFRGLCAPSSADLYEVFAEIGKTGLIAAVHAEEDSLIGYFAGKDDDPYSFGRPPVVELEAVARSLVLARTAGARLAICHTSLPESVELVDSARGLGQEVYMETCLHYLVASHEEVKKVGPFAKIKPPLRDKERAAKLYQMYCRGKLDYLGSDHAPFTKEEKLAERTPDGLAATELTLPLLLARVKKGEVTLERIVETCCHNPARVFGLYPRKGAIAVGADADLVLLDLSKSTQVRLDCLKTRAKACATIYEGWETGGEIVLTMVRGQAVIERGEITGKPGWGQFIRPEPVSSALQVM